MSMDLITKFSSARMVGTPLLGITTSEPRSLIEGLVKTFPTSDPVLLWDSVRGLTNLNPKSNALKSMVSDDDLELTQNPTFTLNLLHKLPPDGVVFFLNAHRHLTSCSEGKLVSQAVWNLRDPFKITGRTLVLLGPILTLPSELVHDVILLDDPLPNEEKLTQILERQYSDAGVELPDDTVKRKAIDSLRGLSVFSAEQVIAMSMKTTGVDTHELWEYRSNVIEQTKGLIISRSMETYEDIGGLESVKEFMSMLFGGRKPPSAIIFIDELEKMIAGATNSLGDNTGISQDALGVMLKAMENYKWTGILAVGVPGSGKSLIAKATGNTFNIPTMEIDTGATKASLVGESEQAIRSMVKVIHAVSGDGAYFIATCNRLESLPPELMRRFTDGIWYFDLPMPEEKKSIWDINLTLYDLDKSQELPDDTDWTGADIAKVCRLAWRTNCSLMKAAENIVPVVISNPDSIEALRRIASGRFRSASFSGVYKYGRSLGSPVANPLLGHRKYSLDSLD